MEDPKESGFYWVLTMFDEWEPARYMGVAPWSGVGVWSFMGHTSVFSSKESGVVEWRKMELPT